MLFKALTIAAAVVGAAAQRPTNTSICDYYTTALLKNNTAANQLTLLTLVVNTAVIGNYTLPNVGISVPGILAKGTFNGTAVNLLPYFTGALASSNRGGMSGVSVNFLDDGGAGPLLLNQPANGTTSNQYKLLTHLYEYFGTLLGCSQQGNTAYPAYSGQASQYNVHKFMDLSAAEVGYFIQQVALSAASFGVATDDLTVVGTALGTLFDVRCAPPTIVIPAQGAQLQSICTDSTCALAVNSTCASYANVTKPLPASSSSGSSTPSSTSGSSPSGTAAGSASASPTKAPNSAAAVTFSAAAIFAGIAAFIL